MQVTIFILSALAKSVLVNDQNFKACRISSLSVGNTVFLITLGHN